MRVFVINMKVVNDVTEREVKNECDFAQMTRVAGDRDDVELAASDHRGRDANLHEPNFNNI